MSQALYRRYRSKSFDDVVGQEHVTSLLKEAVNRGIISHAYLFTGPRGTGKTSVARILAHSINELPYSDVPHLDIIEIDAASNRRIDDIRDLREKVHIAPTSATYKVYIIDEVHMLTGESFNALLKTLEEPPAHVVFILATTELHKVPATIISRTQRFHFRPGSISAISQHLSYIAKREKIDINSEAIELIAEHSEGGFRDALSLLDQIASSSDKAINRSHVGQLLGVVPSDHINQLVDSMLRGDTKSVAMTINELYDSGASPLVVSQQLSRTLVERASERPKLYELLNELLDINRSSVPNLKLLALVAKFTANVAEPAASTKKPHLATAATPPLTVASQPISRQTPHTAINDQTSTIEQDDKQGTPKPAESTTSETFEFVGSELSWEAILEVAQKRAPAIYGIIRRAEAECNTKEITLMFQYSLHRKKLSDPKYRLQLSSIIESNFGCRPEITIADKTQASLNPEVAAVADIMGGGKPVNA